MEEKNADLPNRTDGNYMILVIWSLSSMFLLIYLFVLNSLCYDNFYPHIVSTLPSTFCVLIESSVVCSTIGVLILYFQCISLQTTFLFTFTIVFSSASVLMTILFVIFCGTKSHKLDYIGVVVSYVVSYPSDSYTIWINAHLGLEQVTQEVRKAKIVRYIESRTTTASNVLMIAMPLWLLFQTWVIKSLAKPKEITEPQPTTPNITQELIEP